MNNSKHNLSPESYCLFSHNSKGSNTQLEYHNNKLYITPFHVEVNEKNEEKNDEIKENSHKKKKKSLCQNYAFKIIVILIFLVCIYEFTFSNKPFY